MVLNLQTGVGQEEVLRTGAGQAQEQLEPFVERGKTALSRLESLFSGELDITKDPLFQAEERAARSSLARLGLTQSGTGAGSAISQLVTGATQRQIGLEAPFLQSQIAQGFQGAGAISSLQSGLGKSLAQTGQFGQQLGFQQEQAATQKEQFQQKLTLQEQMLDFQKKQLRAQQKKKQGGGIGALLGGGLGFLVGGPAGAAAGSAIGGGVGQLFG